VNEVGAHEQPGQAPPVTSAEPVVRESPPLGRPVLLRQQWEELIYLHWPYEPADVQRLLPPGVFADTFDGAAWVGLIPFEMRGIRLGRLPSLPRIGSFVEVNVRTYVTDRLGRRAVWFLSLDVPRWLVVPVARQCFGVPYCLAEVTHDVVSGPAGIAEGARHRYRVARRWPADLGCSSVADISVTVGRRLDDAEVTPLDHFLSARWGLLAQRGNGPLRYGRVEHEPWPLHEVSDVTVDQDIIEAAGLPTPIGRPLARYSPGVHVSLARPRRVPAGGAVLTP